jgi:hypothetical protein
MGSGLRDVVELSRCEERPRPDQEAWHISTDRLKRSGRPERDFHDRQTGIEKRASKLDTTGDVGYFHHGHHRARVRLSKTSPVIPQPRGRSRGDVDSAP